MPIRIRTEILDADLARASRDFARNSERAFKHACGILVDELVDRTRVDTGRAVSNWRVGAGYPPSAVIEPHLPGSKGSTAAENRAAAKSAARDDIDRFDVNGRNGSIYVVNNVDYLQYIKGIDTAVEVAIAKCNDFLGAQRDII